MKGWLTDDDEPPFMMPGELERMRQEARRRIGGRPSRSIIDEINEALKQPPLPQVEDKPKL